MTAEGDRRRPGLAAAVLIAVIGSGLVAPFFLGGPVSDPALTGAYVRAAGHDSFTLSSPITLLDMPRVILDRGTISIAAGKDGSAAALSALLAGGRSDLVLDAATIIVDHTAQAGGGSVTAQLGEAIGPMAAAVAALNFETLTLRNATIVIKTPHGGEETLHSLTGVIKAKRESALEANGTFRLRGEEVAFDIAGAAPQGKKDAPVALRAAMKSRLLQASLVGHLARGERLQITAPQAKISVANLREAARWLGAEWTEGQQGLAAFEAEGQLDWSEESLSFEKAHFTLDGNKATGALSLTLGPGRPKVDGTLAFDSLDLDPYLTPAASTPRLLTADWLAFLRIPGTVSSSLIRQVDADVRISARAVSLADQVLGKCAATLSIKDEKLFVELAEIELDQGGTGDGQVGVDMTGGEPRYSIRGRLESFDVGKMVGRRLGPSALEGFGTVDVDLAGAGGTEADVLSSLTGKVEVDMPEGARLGVNVEGLAAAAGTTGAQSGIWSTVAEGATAVDNFVAKFAATGGVLRAEAVTADTEGKVLTAAGTVSLADRALDVTVSIAGDTGKSAKPGTGGHALPESFRVSGPWAAPTVTPVEALPLGPDDARPAYTPAPAEYRATGDRG